MTETKEVECSNGRCFEANGIRRKVTKDLDLNNIVDYIEYDLIVKDL
ncbi:MAG: hypothetical protein KKG59_01070 [Nanoarchaeota archaeon]|nr:hypothetical protein [Nanoarchaeota archaeon]